MSTTNNEQADAPEAPEKDGPLLDLTDAGVKKFIKQAKARGYVTMDELNKVLPSEEVTSEAIEDTLDVDIFSPPRQDWLDKSDDYLRLK